MKFLIRAMSLTALLISSSVFAEKSIGDKGQFYIAPGVVLYEGPGASNIG